MLLHKKISEHVKKRHINISAMARDTGISYMALYDSLAKNGRDRSLRDDELLAVCKFLGVNPMDFADKPEKEVM